MKTEVSLLTVHTTSEEFKNTTNTGHFGFVFEKSRDYRDVIVFEKIRFQNVFSLHENGKPAFSNSSCLKSVFQKLCFRDGLVWTVGLTVEINVHFQFLRGGVDKASL